MIKKSLKHLKSCNRDMEICGQMQTLSFFPCINFLHVENGGMGVLPLQSKLNCKGRIEQSYDWWGRRVGSLDQNRFTISSSARRRRGN